MHEPVLTLKQIEQQYPEPLRPFKRALLREYLQYKILEIIFGSPFAPKLSFLGGTALRIVYENQRFSEDLDFDNFGLDKNEFEDLSERAQVGLREQGFQVEVDTTAKGAYRCNVRLSGLLFAHGLSPHHTEKILIQIDSAAHGIAYAPDKKILNKFDVFTEIFVTPVDILLSQKINAALNRKRAKGRDFYDIVFLLASTTPNYRYLQQKLKIENADALRKRLLSATVRFDFTALARDVQPFLFHLQDARKVELFRQFIAQASLA